MDFEQLRQLSQGSVDFDGGQRHLRLESRGVVPACRLLIVSPDSRANLARRQAEAPLIAPLDLRGRLSLLAGRISVSNCFGAIISIGLVLPFLNSHRHTI